MRNVHFDALNLLREKRTCSFVFFDTWKNVRRISEITEQLFPYMFSSFLLAKMRGTYTPGPPPSRG